MFNEIGKKIKTIAKIFFYLQYISYIITAIVMFVIAADEEEGIFMLIGLAFLIGGFIVAYLSSFLLYGFGELIDNTSSIDQNLGRIVMDRNLSGSNRNPSTSNGFQLNDFLNQQPPSQPAYPNNSNYANTNSNNDTRKIELYNLRVKNLITEQEYYDALNRLQ